MNTETLNDLVQLFQREVVDSGLKRNIADYASSLPNSQNNIVQLREIAQSLLEDLERLYDGELPMELPRLLPGESQVVFTERPHKEELSKILDDAQLQLPQLFSQLNAFVTTLQNDLKKSENEVSRISSFLEPYLDEDRYVRTEEGKAVVAISFKAKKVTTHLGSMAKRFELWSKVLPLYHQLLKSEAPEDVRVEAVQNGSVEIVASLDINVTLSLAQVFQIAFAGISAYLSYKKIVKPLVETYGGNQKLIKAEESRKQGLLDNIGEHVYKAILDQHRRALEEDPSIDTTAPEMKARQVAKLVTQHVIEDNGYKVLALPEDYEGVEAKSDTEETESGEPDEVIQLRLESTRAHREHRDMTEKEHQKLLAAYSFSLEDFKIAAASKPKKKVSKKSGAKKHPKAAKKSSNPDSEA